MSRDFNVRIILFTGSDCFVTPRSTYGFFTCGQFMGDDCGDFLKTYDINHICLSELPIIGQTYFHDNKSVQDAYNAVKTFICEKIPNNNFVKAETIHELMQQTVEGVQTTTLGPIIKNCKLGDAQNATCHFRQHDIEKLRDFYKCNSKK